MLLAPDRSHTHADLKALGLSQRSITALVRSGLIVRPRQGVYVAPDSTPAALAAARVGGLVGCVTMLAEQGVFVLERGAVHVHVPSHATRLRPVPGVAVHWAPLRRTPPPDALRVEAFDAVLQAVICQSPRAAIATLDSALNRRVIDEADLEELFAHLPKRRRAMRALVDGRAESGSETYVRLLLRTLGLNFESQVWIEGVGRVDFLVEGWLVIECDSRAHHGGWEAQVADRRRDLRLAERGYACIRPVAADIFADTPAFGRVVVAMLERLGPTVHNAPVGSASRRRIRG